MRCGGKTFPKGKVVVRRKGLRFLLLFFFFFGHCARFLLAIPVVILVTYRGQKLPQLIQPGDFMEMKKRWALDEPVNAFRLPRSETEADAITKRNREEKKQLATRYMYGSPNHVGR